MSVSGIAIQQHAASEPRRSGRAQLVTVAAFFALSLALALVAVVAGTPSALLPFVLALGPTVIALVLAWREGDGALGRLRQALTIRPPRRLWYLAIAGPLVWALATVGIGVALGARTGAGLFDTVFPAVAVIFLVVLLPAFAEEIAWRGFALPRLMATMSPLQAALVVAIPWTLIHVGLFLPGQSNAQLLLWPLVLSIVSYSVILTWLFIQTGGSVLMTALVHAGLNAMSPLMVGIDANTQWIVRNVVAAAFAVALIVFGGLRRPVLRGNNRAGGA